MGSILLGIVARSRGNQESKDLNNNCEVGESALCSKEVLLLESPPLGTAQKSKIIISQRANKKPAKIGKLAKGPSQHNGYKVWNQETITVSTYGIVSILMEPISITDTSLTIIKKEVKCYLKAAK